MKIVVTGGAGFIGSHLVGELSRLGHSIAVIDNLSGDYNCPADIQRTYGARLENASICDDRKMLELLEQLRPEVIVHLAAKPGVRTSPSESQIYCEVNVRGTAVILEAARRVDVKNFVFASSSAVYGTAASLPFEEDQPSGELTSTYAVTKLAGEGLCMVYARSCGIRVKCLRFFTVYGPRQRPDLAIQRFIERISLEREIDVFGDGSAYRDFTYVGDVVSGIVGAIHYTNSDEVFNLGSASPVTITEAISTIEMVLGKRALVRYTRAQPCDLPGTFANIAKAQRLLGYSPKISFAEGVAAQAEWFARYAEPQRK